MRVLISALMALTLGVFILGQGANAQTPAPTAPKAASGPSRAVVGTDKSPEDLVKMLQPMVSRAKGKCDITRARAVGAADKNDIYEVVCASGEGELISADVPQSDTSPVSMSRCVASQKPGARSVCTMTTYEQNMAPFIALAAKAPTPCASTTNQRFVGETADGLVYAEYACADGSGFMLQADAAGTVKSQIPCIQAGRIAGGCTLTDAMAASAPQRTIYSNTAKANGFQCNVSNFGVFPKTDDQPYDAVEIACDNRPDGGVIMAKDGATAVVNCIRARAEGLICHLTPEALAFASLSKEITDAPNVKHFTGCVVNGARAIGSGRASTYVEVTCADGSPGLVLIYPLGKKDPSDIVSCSQAGGFGGCRMAANQPKP